MHELAITEQMLTIACEQARGARIKRLVLEIGKLSLVLPEAVRFSFDVCCQGTAAEGAQLDIIEKPGLGRCRRCGGDVILERPLGKCACGCIELDWVSGEELKLKSIEVY